MTCPLNTFQSAERCRHDRQRMTRSTPTSKHAARMLRHSTSSSEGCEKVCVGTEQRAQDFHKIEGFGKRLYDHHALCSGLCRDLFNTIGSTQEFPRFDGCVRPPPRRVGSPGDTLIFGNHASSTGALDSSAGYC